MSELLFMSEVVTLLRKIQEEASHPGSIFCEVSHMLLKVFWFEVAEPFACREAPVPTPSELER